MLVRAREPIRGVLLGAHAVQVGMAADKCSQSPSTPHYAPVRLKARSSLIQAAPNAFKVLSTSHQAWTIKWQRRKEQSQPQPDPSPPREC